MLLADGDHLLDQSVHTVRQAIQFDEENRSRILGKPNVVCRLDRLDRQIVHHFQCCRDHPGLDDVADGVRTIGDCLIDREDRLYCLGLRHHAESQLRDHAERPLRTDHQARQIESGIVK